MQKRGTKAINKLCVREILGLSFVCGAYFFEFRGWKQGRYACALLFSRVPIITRNIYVENYIKTRQYKTKPHTSTWTYIFEHLYIAIRTYILCLNI